MKPLALAMGRSHNSTNAPMGGIKQSADTEADRRAAMLIYLLQNGLYPV